MLCPAVRAVLGYRYPCQRPMAAWPHELHYNERILDSKTQTKVRVEWRQVLAAKRRPPKGVTLCKLCRRPAHNSRTCLSNPAFAKVVRAGI